MLFWLLQIVSADLQLSYGEMLHGQHVNLEKYMSIFIIYTKKKQNKIRRFCNLPTGIESLPWYGALFSLCAACSLSFSTWAWPHWPFSCYHALNSVFIANGVLKSSANWSLRFFMLVSLDLFSMFWIHGGQIWLNFPWGYLCVFYRFFLLPISVFRC